MKATIFIGNQPRHLNLALMLSKFFDELFVILETKSIVPFNLKEKGMSRIRKTYFENVIKSEEKIFGNINFLPSNVRTLSIKSGDINLLSKEQLSESLKSDYFFVFGASFIKGWLIDFLIDKNAINLHIGLSPYYRGSACNFWALYDNNPSYVGATLHYLSKGIDSGDMILHCMPKYVRGVSSFDFTMRSVVAAQHGLLKVLSSGDLKNIKGVKQKKEKQIRYSKNKDFSDNIIKEFLESDFKIDQHKLKYPELINPIFY